MSFFCLQFVSAALAQSGFSISSSDDRNEIFENDVLTTAS